MNIVVITSVINIPDKPFSYTSTRSIFSKDERFEQTKYTITNIRNKIPCSKILLVECSELNEEETRYISENVDYFINLYGDPVIENDVFGLSKSMGENVLLLNAIDYLNKNNIKYENFYKMSGRYWLNDNFDYEKYNNDKITYGSQKNDDQDVYTSFYKLNYKHMDAYIKFIYDNMSLLKKCICTEIFFGIFLETIDVSEKYDLKHTIGGAGVSGHIAVWTNFVEY